MDEIIGKLKDGASKAKVSAERIAKEVAKRTSNAITHTKLSFSINETQSKVKDIYSEIGKTIYEQYLDGADFGDAFADSFKQLDELHEEIESLTAKVAELKDSTKCPECGAMNSKDAEYCSKCGSHIEDEEPEEEADVEQAFSETVIAEADGPIIIQAPKVE